MADPHLHLAVTAAAVAAVAVRRPIRQRKDMASCTRTDRRTDRDIGRQGSREACATTPVCSQWLSALQLIISSNLRASLDSAMAAK